MPAHAGCTVSDETDAGKSTNIPASSGDLSDVQPRALVGKAVGFGDISVVEIDANQLDEAARDALRDERLETERAARAAVKRAVPGRLGAASADDAAVCIQSAVRRARVRAAACSTHRACYLLRRG